MTNPSDGSAVPWRADRSLGLIGGLRAHEARLHADGISAIRARLTTAGIITTMAGMGARGFLAAARFETRGGLPFVGRHVTLRGLSYVKVGRRFRIDDYAELYGVSSGGMSFGDNCYVGTYTIIKGSDGFGRLLGAGLKVGDRTSIGPHCYIGCAGGITIGSDVLLAPGVRIFAETHRHALSSTPIKEQGLDFMPVVIEDNCWIASGVTITGGVTVGTGSIVGAGAVVTKDVAPRSIVGGNPARLIRMREDAGGATA